MGTCVGSLGEGPPGVVSDGVSLRRFSQVSFSGVGRLCFFGPAGADLGAQLASYSHHQGIPALRWRGAIAARGKPRFTFDQPVSALLAEGIATPARLCELFYTAIGTSHGECPVNCSPWREHGHSDVALVERHEIGAILGLAPKSSRSLVYSRPTAASTAQERYLGPKTARQNPHHMPCDARNRRQRRSCCEVDASRGVPENTKRKK